MLSGSTPEDAVLYYAVMIRFNRLRRCRVLVARGFNPGRNGYNPRNVFVPRYPHNPQGPEYSRFL